MRPLPWVFHVECGYKALLQDYGQLSYWRRWSNAWVPIDSPL